MLRCICAEWQELVGLPVPVGYKTKRGFSQGEVFAYQCTQPLLYYNVIILQALLRDKIVYDGNRRGEHNAGLGASWQHARSNSLLTCIRQGINIRFCDIFD